MRGAFPIYSRDGMNALQFSLRRSPMPSQTYRRVPSTPSRPPSSMQASGPLSCVRAFAALCTRAAPALPRHLRENAVDPKTVVFECYAGRGYTCSPRAIYEADARRPAFRRLPVRLGRAPGDGDRVGGTRPPVEQPWVEERGRGARSGARAAAGGREALEQLGRATIVPYGRSRTTSLTPARGPGSPTTSCRCTCNRARARPTSRRGTVRP